MVPVSTLRAAETCYKKRYNYAYMSKQATPLVLSQEEEETLRFWSLDGSLSRRQLERAQIVLLAAEGRRTGDIAAALQTRPARVSKWRTRFAKNRLAGLVDLPRPGARHKYDAATDRRILDQLANPPPAGHATWTGNLLAQTLSDVSVHQIWKVLRRHGISLNRRDFTG